MGTDVDVDSEFEVAFVVVSVDGTVAVAVSSFSVVSVEAGGAAFFLLARGAAGFFFSPLVLLFFRDFGGRVSGTTIPPGFSSDVGDAVVGAVDVDELDKRIFIQIMMEEKWKEIYLLIEDAGVVVDDGAVGGTKGNG